MVELDPSKPTTANMLKINELQKSGGVPKTSPPRCESSLGAVQRAMWWSKNEILKL
jgi:hypothetical protein